jgi:DNA primase
MKMASNENKDPIGYLMDKFRSLLGLKNSQEKKNAIPPKARFSIWYPTGLVGRHPDDRGVRWLKQQTREIALTTKSWLYGIDKAGRYIRKYRTIILVEGIFDYFAFYSLLQDQDKPVVVSTLGSYLTPEAANILKGLDIEHFIVAYNWDEAGRNGIERIAAKLGGWVYYLGGLAVGQDPYDMLKPVVNAISGFSLKHLKTGAQ